MTKIICLFCCFNRKEITKRVIKQLQNEKSNDLELEIIVIDDNSNDGTYEYLKSNNDIECVRTPGNYYYSRSMNYGMQYVLNTNKKGDYILILNDDVDFKGGFLNKMIEFSKKTNNTIIIGSTCSSEGKLTYGGIRYSKKTSLQVSYIGPNDQNTCDTFNANCVLIPFNAFINYPIIDNKYTHSFGDFDYGLMFKRNGYKLIVFDEYVGICNRNTIENTWLDKSLSIGTRIKKKEHPKGLPFKENFYFSKKNFGIFLALKSSITPYLRIFMKR